MLVQDLVPDSFSLIVILLSCENISSIKTKFLIWGYIANTTTPWFVAAGLFFAFPSWLSKVLLLLAVNVTVVILTECLSVVRYKEILTET